MEDFRDNPIEILNKEVIRTKIEGLQEKPRTQERRGRGGAAGENTNTWSQERRGEI